MGIIQRSIERLQPRDWVDGWIEQAEAKRAGERKARAEQRVKSKRRSRRNRRAAR